MEQYFFKLPYPYVDDINKIPLALKNIVSIFLKKKVEKLEIKDTKKSNYEMIFYINCLFDDGTNKNVTITLDDIGGHIFVK